MSRAEQRSTGPVEPAGIAFVVAGVGAAARWWVRNGAAPLRWNDSADYLASSRTGWFTSDRWLGPRPVLMPAVLRLVGRRLQLFIDLQLIVASLAWALLALAVATGLATGWRRWVAGGAVLGLSLVGPLVMWDQQVLTESLAISALVLAAAAVTWAAQGLDRPRAVALIAAVVILLLARDSHVIPVLVAAVGLGVWAWWRRPARMRLALLTAAYLAAFAFVASGAATWGQRELVPLEHVYAVRILPYPDRLDWFADHGMPEAARLLAAPLTVSDDATKAPFVPLKPGVWPEWRRWLARDGRSTFVRYVASHPSYVLGELHQSPERVFNNGDGIGTYRPLALRSIPFVTATFWAPVPATVLAALLAVTAAIWREVERSPLVIAGAVLVATAAPHALVVWHSDGMESARHLLIPGAQLRVGTLLLVLGAALARPPTARGTGRWPRVRWNGRRPPRRRRGAG